MLLSAVSRHVSASWAMALMRMRSASRKMRRLTPTSARSSDLSVLSQAASSALASSSLFECASKALSEVGGFLPLSLTSLDTKMSRSRMMTLISASLAATSFKLAL